MLVDVNGDGPFDYVYVSGAGSKTNIRIVDGRTGTDLVSNFQPYEEGFTGGMFVDVGDFNGDGRDEIVISPDNGGSARVQVFSFDGTSLVRQANFFGIDDPNFRGGGSIAISDVNGDGTPDLVVGAAKGGSQRIATFDGKQLFGRHSFEGQLFNDYFAPLQGVDPTTYRGGVALRSQDVNGDGKDDIVMFPAVAEGVNPVGGIVVFHGSASGPTLRFQSMLGTNSTPLTPFGSEFEFNRDTRAMRELSVV